MADTSQIKAVNLHAGLARMTELWSPHIAGKVNGQDVRVAKIQGAFDWHFHDGIEEAFLILKGALTMRFRDRDVPMEEGDFLVVPAGVEHMPVADDECWIMLIEDASTLNTGNVETEKTRRDLPTL